MNAPIPTSDPHPIWHALLSPARSVEVRAWLRNQDNARQAVQWRGPRGESMLHWGAMSDLGLMIDLIGTGLDPNVLDAAGRTPADWLCERLWMTHEEGIGNLTNLNLKKLRVMTDDLLSALWRQGGRVEDSSIHLGVLAVKTGLWQTLETRLDLEGGEFWKHWPTGSPLHVWPLAPAEQGREDFLDRWLATGKGVDPVDDEGRSPLFIAVQARLAPDLASRKALDLDAAIDALLSHGANPNLETQAGESPLSLLLVADAPPAVVEHLGGRLEKAVPPGQGLRF